MGGEECWMDVTCLVTFEIPLQKNTAQAYSELFPKEPIEYFDRYFLLYSKKLKLHKIDIKKQTRKLIQFNFFFSAKDFDDFFPSW